MSRSRGREPRRRPHRLKTQPTPRPIPTPGPIARRVQQTRFEDPQQRTLVSVLVVAAHLNAALDSACAAFGITHFQYNVLRMLRGAGEDGLTRRQIEERIIDRTPDVTRLLDRLVKRGLVVRGRGTQDKRTSVATVTPAGRELLGGADAAVRRVRMDAFGEVPEETLDAISAGLDQAIGS